MVANKAFLGVILSLLTLINTVFNAWSGCWETENDAQESFIAFIFVFTFCWEVSLRA